MQYADPALLPREALCPSIEGNSDFYGLGIRIGVYLQWLSSWISNSVNPDAAATNHDTNTVFLCALLIATAVAFSDGPLQLSEKYILLLLSSGFFCTVLSFLGLRLRFLQPSSLRPFRQAVVKTYAEEIAKQAVEMRWKLPNIGFRPDSNFRHPALSWAGVVVRSSIGLLLAVLSLLTWWTSPKTTADRTNPCITVVYFFGPRDLSRSLFEFFRVATILLTIPLGYLFLYSAVFVLKLIVHGANWLMRYAIINVSECFFPGAWDRLEEREKVLFGALIGLMTGSFVVLDPFQLISGLKALRKRRSDEDDGLDQQLRVQPGLSSDPDHTSYSNEFWNINSADCPPFSEFLQAITSLLSRGVDTTKMSERPSASSMEPVTLDRCLAAFAHLLILATIACFVLFVEQTILEAGITGVNTIRTTGQLIPFVIGVVSVVVALRDLVMLSLWKKYPQWSKRHIVFETDTLENYVPRITVAESDQDLANPPVLDIVQARTTSTN